MAGSSSSGSPRTPRETGAAKRSRKGCWTCRVRKVKCDEARPFCRQCTRLQLKCEGYGVRLSFRDDTRRVMKRMQNTISIHGNPIFDALSRKHYPQILQIGNENGDLPIVEMLGPSAFEEGGHYYANDGTSSRNGSLGPDGRRNSKSDEATGDEIILESLLSLGASNAIEIENIRHQTQMFHNPSPIGSTETHSLPRSNGTFTPDQGLPFDNGFPPFHNCDIHHPEFFNESMFMNGQPEVFPQTVVVHRSLPPIAPPGISTDNERKFLHHYLHVISARITSPDRGRNNPFRNTFARLATDFPPLLHGILAISAADLSRYDRTTTPYESFLHYQGCISMLATALNEPSTLVADEALATICLLFLHEMSNMDGMGWRRHMLGAKEIVHQKAISGLPKGRDAGFLSAFMSQWEALTAVTTGETPLLDFLTQNNLLLPGGKGLLFPNIQKSDDERAEYTLVGPMNAFQRPLTNILSRIAKLAHRSRILPTAGYTTTPGIISNEEFDLTVRQIEQELEQLWEQKRPAVIDDLMTFESADEVFRTRWRRGVPTAQRVASLYRACVIYLFRTKMDRQLMQSPYLLHESIWDREGIDEQPPHITQAVEDILTVTRDIVKTKMEKERRFMLFPLLCAGLECREIHEQEFILHVLEEMGYVSWGNNFPKTKALLQEIFKRQGGVRVSAHGHGKVEGRWRRVDWLGVLFEMGPFVFV